MSSIRKRGKYYGVQFRIPEEDGNWKQVSVKTKTADVNDARRFGQNAEQMALKAKAADKVHGMEYCETLLNAIRDAGASRLTESKAREHLNRICEIARGKPLVSYSVRNWFAEYLRQKKPNVATSTFAAYEWCYGTFEEHLGPRADAGIEFVEHSDVRAWRDAQKASGLSDKRVNNLLKYLSGPFAKAAKTGMIPINPVAATESLRVSDSVDRKPFLLTEVNSLLLACPTREWRVVLLLGVYCGMRLGDASRRKIGDFDLDKGIVTFIPEKKKKSGKEVVLPLHASLLLEIRELIKGSKSEFTAWLTPTLAVTSIGGKTGLSNLFIGIMATAKVERGTSVEGQGRGRTRFERSFHSTRHTASTWLANEGIEEDLRMLVTDHESREVAKRYTHHSVELLRAAVAKMPSILPS
ncbi:MAG: site-specific integrase [Verrucomicrobiota bacterium]